MKTSCILVDDEPIALKVMNNHLSKIPTIDVVANCAHALEAFQVLCQRKVDLVFLDIQMPQITGIDFLKSLRQAPKVILTTAHREYALEGYELDVVDYLLKPIGFERLLKALDKYYKSSTTSTSVIDSSWDPVLPAEINYMYVKKEKKIIKIFFADIVFVESLKDYVKIHTYSEEIVTKQQISYFEKVLPKVNFIRIHRAYIISVKNIKSFTATTIQVLNFELPIGRSYKSATLSFLYHPEESFSRMKP